MSSNVHRRSSLLLRRFQRSRHVVVALLNTESLKAEENSKSPNEHGAFQETNFGLNPSSVEALLKNGGRKLSVSRGTRFVTLYDYLALT